MAFDARRTVPVPVLFLGLALSCAGLLAAAGCSFDPAGLASRLSCRSDDDCLDGWRCGSGTCRPRGGPAPDASDGAPTDLGPTRDLAPPAADLGPDRSDLGPDDVGARPDGGDPPPTDAGGPVELGPPADGGEDAADAAIDPPDPDLGPPPCRDELCPAGTRCNPFGACVPAQGEPAHCSPCAADGDCGGSRAVCFDGSFLDPAGGSAGDGRCAASCNTDGECPAGMACRVFTRDERSGGVCRPRGPGCEAWLSFAGSCGLFTPCVAPGSFCDDLHEGLGTDYGCTYSCAEDADCPAGAICQATFWNWVPYCRLP